MIKLVHSYIDSYVDIAFDLYGQVVRFKEYRCISSVIMGNIPFIYIKSKTTRQWNELHLMKIKCN